MVKPSATMCCLHFRNFLTSRSRKRNVLTHRLWPRYWEFDAMDFSEVARILDEFEDLVFWKYSRSIIISIVLRGYRKMGKERWRWSLSGVLHRSLSALWMIDHVSCSYGILASTSFINNSVSSDNPPSDRSSFPVWLDTHKNLLQPLTHTHQRCIPMLDMQKWFIQNWSQR